MTDGTWLALGAVGLVSLAGQRRGSAASRPSARQIQSWWVAAYASLADAFLNPRLTWIDEAFVIRRELWSEECLWGGVGSWDQRGVATTLQQRRGEYQEEFGLRCQLPSYDFDAPPKGAGELVLVEWQPLSEPISRPPFEYEMMQLAVWRLGAE